MAFKWQYAAYGYKASKRRCFMMEQLYRKCRDCNGARTITGTDTVSACCEKPNKDGSCCGLPVPSEVPVQEQCPRCKASGFEPIFSAEEVQRDFFTLEQLTRAMAEAVAHGISIMTHCYYQGSSATAPLKAKEFVTNYINSISDNVVDENLTYLGSKKAIMNLAVSKYSSPDGKPNPETYAFIKGLKWSDSNIVWKRRFMELQTESINELFKLRGEIEGLNDGYAQIDERLSRVIEVFEELLVEQFVICELRDVWRIKAGLETKCKGHLD
jgi:hypothetical protein